MAINYIFVYFDDLLVYEETNILDHHNECLFRDHMSFSNTNRLTMMPSAVFYNQSGFFNAHVSPILKCTHDVLL